MPEIVIRKQKLIKELNFWNKTHNYKHSVVWIYFIEVDHVMEIKWPGHLYGKFFFIARLMTFCSFLLPHQTCNASIGTPKLYQENNSFLFTFTTLISLSSRCLLRFAVNSIISISFPNIKRWESRILSSQLINVPKSFISITSPQNK